MAEATTTEEEKGKEKQPNRPPGTLVRTEVSYREPVTCDDQQKAGIKSLVTAISQRDLPARREQVIRTWERRLFDRGFQHLLPMRNGGWVFPAVGSGYGPGEDKSRSMFETNVIASYGEIIQSALTREVPTTRFKPGDPDQDQDITFADAAQHIRTELHRKNNINEIQADAARYLWTDGIAVYFTAHYKDGQAFGYEPDQEEVVPEDEEAIGREEQEAGRDDTSENSDSETDLGGENDAESGEASEPGSKSREPKGWTVTRVVGALESKFPIKANCISECGYGQIIEEIPVNKARTEFPDVADDIKPSSGGPGGDDIDRLARINVRLGIMDEYVTTDSQVYDVTKVRSWIRPEEYQDEKVSDEIRTFLYEKFPDGLYVIFCGEVFCQAINATMDDYITFNHAKAGDGMNRPAMCDWVMPIQKVLNNWLELLNDYITRGVPAKWMDNEMFNVEALRDQVNGVGEVHPFTREDGVQMAEVIWEETPVPFPEHLIIAIQYFVEELPQLLSGAVLALSGGGDSSPTDTFGGMLVQRDQAIGRLGIAWRHIKEATANMDRQAVQCLARNDQGTLKIDEDEAITIELRELKGTILAFPEVDENFPETPTQKSNRMMTLFTGAETNPLIMQFLDTPDNLEEVKDSIGLEKLVIPILESRDKQLGENVLLLKAAPTPNPAILQAKQQLEELVPKAQQAAQAGQVDQEAVKQIAALTQQIQQLMQTTPEVSTVPIDIECDDHATEAAVALRVINSPRGRKLKDGDPEEQAAFKNLRLHYLEHAAAAKQKAAEAAQNQQGKPPSLSANLKDLPPKEAVALLQKAGIQASPQDFIAEKAEDAAEKHPGPGGVAVTK